MMKKMCWQNPNSVRHEFATFNNKAICEKKNEEKSWKSSQSSYFPEIRKKLNPIANIR